MRTRLSAVSLLLFTAVTATAQVASKPKKPSLGGIFGKLADTLASSMAAGMIDSALGSKVRGMLSTGNTPCAVRDPSSGAIVSVVQGGPAGPGATIVSAAKEAAGAKKPGPAAATPAVPALGAGACPAGSTPLALGDMHGLSAMSAGPMGAPAVPMGYPGAGPVPAMPGLGAIAAATPVGMAASVAPGAFKGAKKLFGGGPMSAEDMAKGLARGRLELKGVKFLPGSDDLQEGAGTVFQQLAEVLGGFKAQFQLFIAPEAEKGVEPDVELAQRRVEKAMALLLTSGIPEGTITVGGATPKDKLQDGKYPKLGNAKLELIKVVKAP
jgi:hypothetical protein